jgi:flagellar biosynthetic protein FliR
MLPDSGQLPLIPFVHSPEDIFFFFLVLLRVSGLFIISPVLSHSGLKGMSKSLLTLLIAGLMTALLWNDYRGPNARLGGQLFAPDAPVGVALYLLSAIKELAVGYIIGFCFFLVIEALAIAGQIVSIVIGFSIAEMLDPVSGSNQSLISTLFVIAGTVLILSLYLHHLFLRACAESFSYIPLGAYFMPYELMEDLSKGSARILHYALQYAAVPYVILLLITVGLGFMAKVMPEMNIFMVGFPLRIFVGYYAMIFAISFFPVLLQKSFIEFNNLIELVLLRVGGHK